MWALATQVGDHHIPRFLFILAVMLAAGKLSGEAFELIGALVGMHKSHELHFVKLV